MGSSIRQRQHQLARICLEACSGNGFALAGSGALREHGITNRPTEDIDLFTVMDKSDSFIESVATMKKELANLGYTVTDACISETFAHLNVITPEGVIGIDAALDWRAHGPVQLEIGPVLDIEDAVTSKIVAMEGRKASRDYLDVDAIRQCGRFTDEQLLTLTEHRDPGFCRRLFAQALRDTTWLNMPEDEKSLYQVNDSEITAISTRLGQWADQIDAHLHRL